MKSINQRAQGFEKGIHSGAIMRFCVYDLPFGAALVDLPHKGKGIAIGVLGGGESKIKRYDLSGNELRQIVGMRRKGANFRMSKEGGTISLICEGKNNFTVTEYTEKLRKKRVKIIDGFSPKIIIATMEHLFCINRETGEASVHLMENGEIQSEIFVMKQEMDDFKGTLVITNPSEEILVTKEVASKTGTFSAMGAEKNGGKAYLAFDREIMVFEDGEYAGVFEVPCGQILGLNVDPESSHLMISTEENGLGRVDLVPSEVVSELLIGNENEFEM